ncbi:MAG TPA: CDGSH iron-sulfur domain-containing protein, partial [Aggregatilineales bacterium]|nr:CDGSH iron-sulfur domain-containing protein [Aggregatilineales bacterium]
PSGALHYDRKDGVKEIPAGENVIRIQHNGALEIRGDLAIQGTNLDIPNETRMALCRCGASKNKPFCDNAHNDSGFEAVETAPIIREGDHEKGGKLTIIAHTNGPLEVQGNFEIIGSDGVTLFRGNKTWLCRCGG